MNTVERTKLKEGKRPIQVASKTLSEGELLCEEGSIGRELYIVSEGKVGVYKITPESTTLLATVGKNGIIGEMSLLDNQPRSATIKALETTKVIVITDKYFAATLQKAPQWLTSLIKIIVSRLRDANKRVDQSVLRDKERGLISLLLLLQPESSYQFGDATAMSLENVLVEAYYVCRLRKKETEQILSKIALRSVLSIEEDSDKNKHVCIRDSGVLKLYYEYLTLKAQKKKFKELSIDQECLGVLSNLAYVAQKSGRISAEGTELLRSVFIKDFAEKNAKKTDQILFELRRKNLINMLPQDDDSLILFHEDVLRRIKKIHEWIPKFEMDIS
ncbi:MAG: cyclic nucleotide-binding domain-containing protein [Chitinivibrionales bacterium]|nr:cyclic nucleotide-binding domain-containing protein [Chitinivibrionales bacterium]